MGEPIRFKPVDMQQMLDEGVLMTANEEFFWPLGLALTWTVDDGRYLGDLHIREWVDETGEWCGESIALAPDDLVGRLRAKRYNDWVNDRLDRLEGE